MIKKEYLKNLYTGILAVCISALLVSCGSGGGGGGGASGTSKKTATITLSASPAEISADGVSSSSITATLKDSSGTAVPQGTSVTFSTNLGKFGNGETTYTIKTPSENGTITVSLISGTTPGEVNVTATSDGTTQAVTLNFTGTTLAISSIELASSPESLPADGKSKATISATVTLVGGGNAPDGTTVNFSITKGGGSITSSGTTASGVATASLTSGTASGTATIRAEAGGRTGEIQVEYTPGSVTLTIVPNSLLGTGDATATVTATLETAAGNPAPNGEAVAFTLSDTSMGTVTPAATTVSGGQGEAEVTFQDAAKGGTVTITATWTTGGVDVTGSESITIQPPPAFIQVADNYPDPASINIKGTGGQSTSQIVFDVRDSQGNLVTDGYRIDFDIDSGPNGGEDILPLYDATSSGQVSTILRSGSKSGPVSINATFHNDKSISTTTSQIAINAGPPVGEEFGIFAEYLNISGLSYSNIQDQISINAGDIYGNSIPDNTAISFKTYNTGGFFTPNTATTTGGLATNNLHSSDSPTPVEGFVSVTAEANNGGRTTHVTSMSVAPDPHTHIIYAGTDGGGVYKSTDSGASWTNISRSSTIQGQNWIDPYVNDIDIDPDNHNTVYAATGYLGQGNVYRSLDGGMSWNSNNKEEVFGLLNQTSAMLAVLCDDGGSDYVWVGTEGLGALRSTDGEDFDWGGTVTAPAGVGNTGNGTMTTPTLSSSTKTETWTATYQQTGASTSTPVLDTNDSGSEADGTMTGVSATSTADTEAWTITYEGGYSIVTKGGGDQGDLTIVSTSASTVTETWTVTCIDGKDGSEIFSVKGSVSGLQTQLTNIAQNYTTDNSEVTFLIEETGNFAGGETFTFSTDRDAWTVTGTESAGPHPNAKTDVAYTSDNSEISFTINSGTNYFYQDGDTWTFDTTVTGNWQVEGTVSGIQSETAENGVEYSSDNSEVTFTITEGTTSFVPTDSFTFDTTASGLGYGKEVRDIVKVTGTNGITAVLYAATATGVFRSTNGGLIWAETKDFSGDNITTLALHPDSDGVTDIIYAGTVDAGIWASTDSGANWTRYEGGLGEGLSASTPVSDPDNTGNGTISEVAIGSDTLSEYWTVTCKTEASDGGTFSVSGSVSGDQADYDITAGTYTIANVLSFTITDGSTDFKAGDRFTFTTTRDPGNEIKDLMVDPNSDLLLYAVTYFWGPLEPHAVGNLYVHDLNADGSMTASDWAEANTGLPQYDPPDDTTLFAQHVIVPDVSATPAALYIGGEGINLYKASTGLSTGSPSWETSKTGLTNLIMARMPILFSGECTMSITSETSGSEVTYTVYVEDVNGNPPVSGSTLVVTYKPAAGEETILLEETYGDCYTHEGTWRDPTDPDTNDPYVISVTVSAGDKVEFAFTTTDSLPDPPGYSGSSQTVTYSY